MSASGAAATPTVFVVDDDDAVRDSLGALLKRGDWTVEMHASADAFLGAYDPNRPGCLLLDVRMPAMSGPELQDRLSEKGYAIPIIFITGHGDIPLSVRTIKAGAIDFFEKPFPKETLLERIREAVALDAEARQIGAWKRDVMARYARLTPREREVTALVIRGLSSKEIARELNASHRTVDTHRARIMDKMQTDTVPDLVTAAVACGLHDPQS